jgi:uncharacterized cofD-like protein
MTAIEDGDFEEGVRQVNRVLAVRGPGLPVSRSRSPFTRGCATEHRRAVADLDASGIERVWVSPAEVRASEDALSAIAEADVIVLGPGSLYTSILPTLLVPAVREAVAASPALRVYVCNVATQHGETDGYDLAAHLEAVAAHTTPGMVDVVLANNQFHARTPADWHAEASPPALAADASRCAAPRARRRRRSGQRSPRSARLAAALMRLVEREGPRRRAGMVRSA